jgi:WD40 repeat protein
VYDLSTGAEVFALHGHKKEVREVAYRPDSQQMASASWDGTIKFWDAETGRLLR